MSTVNPSALGPKPQLELSDGTPAVGNKLFFYVAGSVNTKAATYTDSTGTVPNTNPVVLNALGMPTTQIWWTAGQSYKIVYAPSTDTDPPTSPIFTIDNLFGNNDTTSAQSEWVSGPTPTFVSATSFTLVGDQTTNFHVGRRIKGTVTAGTSYGTITGSAFAVVTTLTVDTTGSNALDSGLSAVSYGLLSAANFAQSAGMDVVSRQSADVASATTTNLDAAGGDLVDVTGTTTITAITLARGKTRTVRFTGALTLTNGASLVLPGAANITTAAGDYAIFRGYAAGVVRCVGYSKANGKAVVNTANTQPTRTVLSSGSGTYTTPANATRISLRGWGAGGGGGASGTGSFGAAGTAGGNTTFSTVTANGGGFGGTSTSLTFAAGGTATGGDLNFTGMDGMSSASVAYPAANSGDGGATSLGGAGRGSYPGGPGQSAKGSTGSGGGAAGGAAGVAPGASGAAGGYSEKTFIAPAASYSYAVGAKGTGGVAGTSGFNGGDGAAGLIVVDEYYD